MEITSTSEFSDDHEKRGCAARLCEGKRHTHTLKPQFVPCRVPFEGMPIVSLWAGEPHRHSSETGDGVLFIRSVCDGDPLSPAEGAHLPGVDRQRRTGQVGRSKSGIGRQMVNRDPVVLESVGPWQSAFRKGSDAETRGTSLAPSLGFSALMRRRTCCRHVLVGPPRFPRS